MPEVPFRCRPLSKRGEDAPLPWSLDGPGDPGNKETFIPNGAPGQSGDYRHLQCPLRKLLRQTPGPQWRRGCPGQPGPTLPLAPCGPCGTSSGKQGRRDQCPLHVRPPGQKDSGSHAGASPTWYLGRQPWSHGDHVHLHLLPLG